MEVIRLDEGLVLKTSNAVTIRALWVRIPPLPPKNMKKWKEQMIHHKFGKCDVIEFDEDDPECDGWHPPISIGFVNLYQGENHLGWCGMFYAQDRLIPKDNWGETNNDIQH